MVNELVLVLVAGHVELLVAAESARGVQVLGHGEVRLSELHLLLLLVYCVLLEAEVKHLLLTHPNCILDSKLSSVFLRLISDPVKLDLLELLQAFSALLHVSS